MDGLLLLAFAALLAFICEYIDSSLGMGYGTILAPVLLLFGFEPLILIPAVLFSQAAAGFVAAAFHHRFENVNFGPGARDSRIVYTITVFGIAATVFAAFVAVSIPKRFLTTYIGLLILTVGILLLCRREFKFSWGKIIAVGLLSAFNKGISGGGFGPLVTSGQIVSGQNYRNSIGITTLTEAPICMASFLTYMVLRGTADWQLIAALCIGATAAAPLGAFATKKFSSAWLKITVAYLTLTMGILLLLKTWVL